MKNRLSLCFVLFLFVSRISLPGQSPCTNPPTCIVNNELSPNGSAGGNMNSSPSFTVNGWYVSHGTPSLFGNDCPTSTNNCSIWMWSYSGSGEGVFTCFDFQQGQTYTICLWVRNTNPISNGGHLQIWMVNNYAQYQNGGSLPPSSVTGQVIDSSYTNNQNWVQLSYTFTPTQTFNELLIYPYMALPPVNFQQYELQIDDIRISGGSGGSGNYAITSSVSPLGWCDSTQLCISGLPTGASVSWLPGGILSDTTGACVYAQSCTAATIQAIISGVSSCPVSCSVGTGSDTLTYQLAVSNPQLYTHIVPPSSCGDSALLTTQISSSCGPFTYVWTMPNGLTYTGDSIYTTNLSPDDSYSVYAVNAAGCQTAASAVSMGEINTETDVFIPNTFTPNGDASNEYFTAYSEGFNSFQMRIFNRWGQLIFETNDPANGWDGKYKGKIVQEDTYVYVIDCISYCSVNREHRIGHVNVIR